MFLVEVLHPAPDPGISHIAFTIVTARALAAILHRSVARAYHNGKPRCPDYAQVRIAGIPWYGACSDCAQFYDDQLDGRCRRLLKIRARVDSGTGLAGEQLLIGSLRSDEARQITVEEAAGRLLTEPKHCKARFVGPARTWEEAWHQLLIARPQLQVTADARRSRAAREGRAARPDRDLQTARWAEPLRDDLAGLEILISYVIGLRDGVADPRAIPPEHSGGLSRREAACRLNTMLTRLQDLRPDWYDANIEAPLAQRGLISVPQDEIESLSGARLLWGPDSKAIAAASQVPASPIFRAAARVPVAVAA